VQPRRAGSIQQPKVSWQQLAAQAREQHLAAQSQLADCNGRSSITLSAAVKHLIEW